MQCGICGFAQPGESNSCPSCGRAVARASASPAPAAQPLIGRGTARLVIYAAIFFGMVRLMAPLYSSYLDAEQERLESMLLRQNMEHRAALRAATDELDAPPQEQEPVQAAADPG